MHITQIKSNKASKYPT